jgi:hypothetical protein
MGMKAPFEPMQLARCIDDKWELFAGRPWPGPNPVLGEIVTVERCYRKLDKWWLILSRYREADYDALSFRPLGGESREATELRRRLQSGPVSHDSFDYE